MPEIEDIVETTETAPLLLWWQWTLIAIAALILIYVLWKLLQSKRSNKPKIDNLQSALKQLHDIKEQQLDDTELATELSILTRGYLQHQLDNKSLFQTHKEFVKDHQDLDTLPEPAREQLAYYLEVLANHKYLPDSNLPSSKQKVIEHTESLLRGIDSTIPRSI